MDEDEDDDDGEFEYGSRRLLRHHHDKDNDTDSGDSDSDGDGDDGGDDVLDHGDGQKSARVQLQSTQRLTGAEAFAPLHSTAKGSASLSGAAATETDTSGDGDGDGDSSGSTSIPSVADAFAFLSGVDDDDGGDGGNDGSEGEHEDAEPAGEDEAGTAVGHRNLDEGQEEKEEKEEEEEEDVYGVRKASTSASASARKVTQHTGVGTTQQRHDQHDNDTAAAGYDWEAASKVLCARLDSMLAAAASIPPQRMQAFNRTVINSIGYHCHATRALVATQAAASAYSAGCSPCAAANLTTALAHLNAIEDIQHFAEGADFRGLFGFDDLTCNPRARRAVQGALEKLTIGAEGQARGWAYGADTISCQGYDLM